MQTRTQKSRAVRASNLNATIGKQSAPLIYPSNTPIYDPKAVAAAAVACHCGACGFKFTSTASIESEKFAPICANCGSGKVTAKKVQSAKLAKDDSSLAAVHCPKCSTWQIQSAALTETLATGCHCITCGEEQILTPEETTEDETTEDTLAAGDGAIGAPADGTDDGIDETQAAAPAASPEAVAPTDTTGDIGNANSGNVIEGGPDETNPGGAQVDAVEPADSTTATVTPSPVAPEAAPVAVAETDVDAGDTDSESEDDDSFGVDEEAADVTGDDDLTDLTDSGEEEFPSGDDELAEIDDLSGDDDFTAEDTDTVEFDDTVELTAEDVGEDQVQFELLPDEDSDETELSFVYTDDRLAAFANGLHVASMSKEAAGKNADLFGTDVLVRSIVAQCRESGIRAGLQSAGFKIVKVSLPIQALVAKRVKAATAKVKAQEAASVKSTAEDWKQAIAVALSGLNKAFFAGKDNPLKTGLIAELSALGVRNPSKLVDKVFAANGGRFNAAVLEIATDVQGKSPEVRNQLAETLDSTTYMNSEEDVDGDGDEDESIEQMSVTARLNGAGHRVVSTAATASKQTEVASGSRIKSILEKTGGSLFS